MPEASDRAGDVEARIALRTKDRSSPWRYLQVAEFCLEQRRDAEALHYAEEGLWVFEDQRPDERLVFFAVDLLAATCRKTDAETHLWRAFEQAPSLELYRRLRKHGAPARERAIDFLSARLRTETSTRWYHPADLLIRVLLDEKMFDAAWATVRKHGVSPRLKESLARASEATHPHEALETYSERVEALANAGGDRAYAEATALITRMAGLRSAAEQTAYIAALKARHGRRRNFMKLLG